ncbi:5'/3'-nucleotidase SurE [Saccharobesus litoralis]|uniref:5'-nucleotidase SurE n=1 Tax=Saccharobesus litoralis TaxID=2172099 RepID=A0A2S0VTT6_9ALTE|nr:5'/3'-nucleotidase SurE [Saccharobesus litoralis]AWB67592.1 5'/3'-nucleotidase SurE [Saccharobesus litoralis]
MRILLSNDDGVHALGLSQLYQHLKNLGEVSVIAPDRNCSGASNSLTLVNPLRVQQLDNGFYSVNGTPTDCVHIGINQLIKPEPDLVISGINHGPNLGDDVIYSGTVAAALEGRHMGHSAIAVSLAGDQHFDSAARVVKNIVEHLEQLNLTEQQILNVNVPDLPYEAIKGYRITRCGSRHRAQSMSKTQDPYGRTIYWYGPQGAELKEGQDTDFEAVRNGFVSITPLTVDMTAHQSINNLKSWLTNLN